MLHNNGHMIVENIAVSAGDRLFAGMLAFACAIRLAVADASRGGGALGLCMAKLLRVVALSDCRAGLQALDAYIGREELPEVVDPRVRPRKLNQYHRHRQAISVPHLVATLLITTFRRFSGGT